MNYVVWCLFKCKDQAARYRTSGDLYRNGPVPHTGRKGRFTMFKYPKTLQEKRENIYLERDELTHELKIKNRRSRNNIPTSWDDYIRSDFQHRSWKRHRKTQWKE